MSECRLGYLVPEFPGQTHAFFWREVLALRKLGVDVDLVSTRVPHDRIQSHSWTGLVKAQTSYLYPISFRQLALALRTLLGARRVVWQVMPIVVVRGRLFRTLKNVGLLLMGAQLAWLARTGGWTHIHVHSCADAALIAGLASRIAGIPYSLTLHGALSDYGEMQAFKWSGAKFGVTVAHHLRRDVEVTLGIDRSPPIFVAPMGVDLETATRSRPYVPWSGQGPIRLVSCGRLNPGKGHQDVIEAVRVLTGKGIAATLRICGQDERGGNGYFHELDALIQDKHLESVVTLLGAVDEETLLSELEKAHIFVLASHQEALGVAYMEAMAMGVPSIGTKVGGVAEVIDDGVNGILVEAQNPERLASAIEQLARDPSFAIQLSEAGREKITRKFGSFVSAELLRYRVMQV